jgi:hypothetical protein
MPKMRCQLCWQVVASTPSSLIASFGVDDFRAESSFREEVVELLAFVVSSVNGGDGRNQLSL